MGTGGDELLTRLIAGGERWDPVEERSALADVRASLFAETFKPIALARYVLLERLGSGGGGIVYRGYDPDLHRKVAIKVLRTGEGSTALASRDRLLREAQAIAQLSHPNVVSVYDVGALEPETAEAELGEGVFMVMELVEGVDLREWLERGTRSQAEILDVFLAAGRGIEAAHGRGIAHRDFKPTNVLVGDDGRVRVLDFGLARALGSGRSPEPRPEPSAPIATGQSPVMLDHELTDVGTVMGTPAYMAPEQHLGELADARTDQYCFCVALYEALAGRRPFEAETLEGLLAAKQAGPGPPGSNVPRRLAEVVQRGLQPAPADRFEDMGVLLTALDRRPARRRTWQIAGLVGGAGILGLWIIAEPTPAPASCDDASGRFEGVWDDATKADAAAAFAATGLPYASGAWSRVERSLDEYGLQWRTAYLETCEATLLDGKQSPEAMGLQMLCLDRQFESFAQLARLVAEADEAVVRNAASATSRLPGAGQCREASQQLEARLDLTAPEREQQSALDAQLLRAGVLRDAGKYDEARALASEVLEAPDTETAPRLLARAQLLTCEIDWSTNHFQDAAESCDAALLAAEVSRSAPLAFRALLRLGRIQTNFGHHDESERIFRIAGARLESIPREQRDPLAEAELAAGVGQLRDAQWREDEAMASYERALELFERALGLEHPDLVPILNGMGMVAGAQDREAVARGHYRRAIAISEKNYGPRHPHVASLLNNLGGVEYAEGQYDEALDSLARSLASKEEQLGPDSPRLVTTLVRLGRVLADMGRVEEAIVHQARAVDLQQAVQGEDSSLLVDPLVAYARTLRIAGQCERAHPLLARARTLVEDRPEASISAAAELDFEAAHCLLATEDEEAAYAAFERSLAREESTRGPEARVPARVLLELARLDLRGDDRQRALTRLELALRRCEASDGDPRLRAQVEFALARALAPADSERALALADQAAKRTRGVPYTDGLDRDIAAWRKQASP